MAESITLIEKHDWLNLAYMKASFTNLARNYGINTSFFPR